MRRILFVLCIASLTLCAQRGRGPAPDASHAFRFRFVGPIAGNRVAAVAGVAGDINTYYAGAASGGIFKSVDGGHGWTPIFDNEPVAAIGALAVAPSDPSVVWAGTGEAWAIRDSDVMGDGVYKSTDAGKTWTHMGLDETGRIGRVLVHPKNPDVVYVCALGRTTGPQQERGVFRTTDGGKHWERVCLWMRTPAVPAFPWTRRIRACCSRAPGRWRCTPTAKTAADRAAACLSRAMAAIPGSASSSPGLPKSPLGKIDVAVAPTDSNRVYALIQTANQGSMWRSDDGGTNWRVVNWDRALIGRAGYYIHLAVSPANENEVFVSNSSFHVSLDGGETFRRHALGRRQSRHLVGSDQS